MLLFPFLVSVRCVSQVMQFQHCNHSNIVWVCLWIFLLFGKWSAFAVCMLHVLWLLVCFALDGFFFKHCHLEFAHFFQWWLSIFFFDIVAVAVVILSLLHSTLIRLMSRYAYKRLIYTGTQALSWYKSNSTHLNHHWNNALKKKRVKQREHENIYLCASGHA